VGVVGVSSDESDDEPRKSTHKKYTRVRPSWRSKDLESLNDDVMESLALSRQPRVGKRKNLGSKPRRRVDGGKVNNEATPPAGTPVNCVDAIWLAGRPIDEDLQLDNRRYDFVNGLTEVDVRREGMMEIL